MLTAARALVLHEFPDVGNDPNQIVSEFRKRFYDTQLFWDPFAGGKFANYLFSAYERTHLGSSEESSRYLIDEAQLFIDAAHSCYNKLGSAVAAAV
jgi:sulfite reductase (ferredoxin)